MYLCLLPNKSLFITNKAFHSGKVAIHTQLLFSFMVKKKAKKRCTHIKDKSPYVRPQKCRYQILEACIILRTEEARDENSTFWLDLALYTGVIVLHTKYMNNCHSSHNYMLICCYCSLLLFLTKMMMTAYIALFSALQQTHCTRM